MLACIASYAQGMALLQEASKLHNYQLDYAAIAQIWKGGCIIRARLLQRIQNAYTAQASLPNLMVDPWFVDQIRRRLPGLRQVVAAAAQAGVPVPCLSSSLDYIDSYFTGRLPQNLVQAMRDTVARLEGHFTIVAACATVGKVVTINADATIDIPRFIIISSLNLFRKCNGDKEIVISIITSRVICSHRNCATNFSAVDFAINHGRETERLFKAAVLAKFNCKTFSVRWSV